ncbi:hypothetical protein AWB76_00947 [Caballeronia temeraria]|uniref:Uncharacterized protein n=1 Tax=Caballeronia temeraria TaxID=1777137 RepID=A0A157ZM83_9BURK|nr:hypothetical protein [Caballeronia temeraria]SAK46634.1 hypothetical protein AWB76_00947 [Caballeronia temeraria]
MSIFLLKRKALGHVPCGSSPSSGGSSTTTQELPGYAQPTAQDILTKSTDLANSGVPQYTGQTYAQANDTQTNAIQGMTNLANSGGVGGQVSGSVANTANNGGNNYGTVQATQATAAQNPYATAVNPYTQQMVNAANQQTTQAFNQNAMNINSQFTNSGAFGGSAYQNAANNANTTLANALANNSANMYGNAYNQAVSAASSNAALATQASLANQSANLQADSLNSSNYNTAQGRALTAASLAPTLDANTLSQLNAAYTGGTALQTNDQNALNAQYQQWYQAAMAPYENLGVEESGLSAALGNGAQGVTNSTQSASPFAVTSGLTQSGVGLLGSLAQGGYL